MRQAYRLRHPGRVRPGRTGRPALLLLGALLWAGAAGPAAAAGAQAEADEENGEEEGEGTRPAVDPDLAEALAADRAQREPDRPPAPDPATALRRVVPLQRLNPKISLILDSALAWHSRGQHIRQAGHAPDDSGFTLQGLELAASAAVDPYFRFDLAFELSHLHIEEAYLTTLALPANLQLRAGFFNAGFGRENPLHIHSWKFVNPSLMHTRFLAAEHFAGLGAELSWLAPLPWYLLATMQVFDSHGRSDLRSSSFGRVELTESGELDGPEDMVYLARLESFFALSPDWSLEVGLSGAWGQSPYAPDDRVTLYGSDWYLKWRPISSGRDQLAVALTVEYLLRDTQVPGDSVRDHGGYLQLDVQPAKRWLLGLRAENVAAMRGVSPDPERLGSWQWRGSAVVTFLPSHFSKIRLQYDAGRAQGHGGASHALFLQAEVSAGEHGAHAF
jgi:hypothetical protein